MPTRWGSTLAMMDRLLTERESVTLWLDKQYLHLRLSESEWRKLEVMTNVLRKCEEVCTLLGGENYVTASVVLPACAYLKQQMAASDDDVGYERKFKEAFYTDLVSRLNRIDCNASLQIATALDPRFKTLKAIPKTDRNRVWTLIYSLMTDIDGDADDKAETIPEKKSKKSKYSIDPDSDDDDEEQQQV